MAKTAAETAQAELDKALATVEKTRATLDKSIERLAAAQDDLETALVAVDEAVALADWLAKHPAIADLELVKSQEPAPQAPVAISGSAAADEVATALGEQLPGQTTVEEQVAEVEQEQAASELEDLFAS